MIEDEGKYHQDDSVDNDDDDIDKSTPLSLRAQRRRREASLGKKTNKKVKNLSGNSRLF